MPKVKLTQKRLKELLDYDPETGIFTWINPVARRLKKGDRAGSVKANGYWHTNIDGKSRYNHRLAWLYVHGYTPENFIDHINRDRADNRIENLREISQSCNTRNTKRRSHNKTGVTGVCFSEYYNKWQAWICVNYKQRNLGNFNTFPDAVKARWEAEKKYSFPECNATSTAYLYLKNTQGGLVNLFDHQKKFPITKKVVGQNKLQKNNTSGVTGVCFSPLKKKWIAQITINYKGLCVGRFRSFKDAVMARWLAEKQYNLKNYNTSSKAYLYLKERGLLNE